MAPYERPHKQEFDEAFAALRAAGLEADADHPIADRYRAASRAVNHASRKLDHIDPQLVADLADAVEFQLDNLDDWPMGEAVLRRAHAILSDGCTCRTCAPRARGDARPLRQLPRDVPPMSAQRRTALFVPAFALGCLAAGLRPFPASGVPMGGACRRASLVGADYRHGQWWQGCPARGPGPYRGFPHLLAGLPMSTDPHGALTADELAQVPGAHTWRITDHYGERIVTASTAEEAERLARYQVSDCGWGSDPIGVIDRGEACELHNLTLYPDEGFCPDCGRGEPHHDPYCPAAAS